MVALSNVSNCEYERLPKSPSSGKPTGLNSRRVARFYRRGMKVNPSK